MKKSSLIPLIGMLLTGVVAVGALCYQQLATLIWQIPIFFLWVAVFFLMREKNELLMQIHELKGE